MTMAHFAQLDENNKVLQVIVVANEELMENGAESEHKGIAFCKTLLGADTNWVQTSYNATIRKNYAGIDYIYDADNDFFFAPQPYPSWELNADAQWEAPVAMPTDAPEGSYYAWNENDLKWDLVTPEGA
jgi:hypothetical protein